MFNIETVRGSKRDSNGTFVSPNSSTRFIFLNQKSFIRNIYRKNSSACGISCFSRKVTQVSTFSNLHDIRVKDPKKMLFTPLDGVLCPNKSCRNLFFEKLPR